MRDLALDLWIGMATKRYLSPLGNRIHLFEVPFYYIEYGIAQAQAIGVWKNSKTDFKKAVNQYENALRLGYTESMPDVLNLGIFI